MIIEWFLY